MHSFRAPVSPFYLIVLGSGFLVPACTDPSPDEEGKGGAGMASGSSGQASSGSAGSSAAVGGRAASTGGGAGTGSSGGTTGVAGALPGAGGATASGGSAQGGSSAAGGLAGTGGGGGASASGPAPGGTGAGGAAAGTSAGGSTAGVPASGGAAGSGSAHTGVWRIMPLGDSITQTTCYPQLLSQKLKDAAHTNFEFLGSSTNNQSCNGAPNVKSEGHGGYILGCLTGDYTSNCASKGTPAELSTWLTATPAPDVALIHFGTNDVWNNIPTSTITTSYTHLLASLREANPSIIVFIAQILPMHPDNCLDGASGCPNNGVKMLNEAIPGWATGASTAASPVYVVDAYNSLGDPAAFVPSSTNTGDGVHPNATGSAPIADAWMSALLAHAIPD